jgi:glutathione S-transferase
VVVLNEIGLQYNLENIDLQNRPDWFLAISPTGKVPVLQTPGKINIFESAVINEYLDEAHEAGMLPGTPIERAHIRMWRDFMAETYGNVYMIYSSPNEDDARKNAKSLQKKLSRAENDIQGPLFIGGRFSFVDSAAAPAFTRLDWISAIDDSLDIFRDLPKAKKWKINLLARESVQNSILPDLEEIFKLRIKENGSWLGSLVSD